MKPKPKTSQYRNRASRLVRKSKTKEGLTPAQKERLKELSQFV